MKHLKPAIVSFQLLSSSAVDLDLDSRRRLSKTIPSGRVWANKTLTIEIDILLIIKYYYENRPQQKRFIKMN